MTERFVLARDARGRTALGVARAAGAPAGGPLCAYLAGREREARALLAAAAWEAKAKMGEDDDGKAVVVGAADSLEGWESDGADWPPMLRMR